MHTGDQIIDAVIRAAAIESAIPHKNGTFTFVWASNASEQIEAALAENAPTCTWAYDKDYGYHRVGQGDGLLFAAKKGYYSTSCGHALWMSHQWDERFKFCTYCGGRISLAEKGGAE